MTRPGIKKASVLELAFRQNYLLFEAERGDDEDGVNLDELEEVVAIDKELKNRLEKFTNFRSSGIMECIKKGHC